MDNINGKKPRPEFCNLNCPYCQQETFGDDPEVRYCQADMDAYIGSETEIESGKCRCFGRRFFYGDMYVPE